MSKQEWLDPTSEVAGRLHDTAVRLALPVKYFIPTEEQYNDYLTSIYRALGLAYLSGTEAAPPETEGRPRAPQTSEGESK